MITDVEAARRVAVQALAQYGIEQDAVLTFVKYRENYVFKVEAESGSYALRLHRSGYRTDAEILEELDLLAVLAAGGVSVPRPRFTAKGESFCRVADEHRDVHQVDMLEWVADAEPFGDVVSAFTGEAVVDPAAFHSLGVLIAELHQKASTQQRQTPSVRPAWDATGLVGGARAVWGDPRRAFHDGAAGRETVDRAMAWLGTELGVYGKAPDRYGQIHADVTPENVLVRVGRMTLIDFDDSGEGYYLFDLATAAFFYLPHPRFDDVVSGLFAGYQTVRPLSAEDLKLWRPMLLARGLTYLAWAADRIGDETSDFIFEHLRPLVVELAAELVASAVSQ
ncbi:phosphotransferase enzyme family protein [Streptomyces mirabilis]|uniref:phosphotransferase enzyme family protein n=1 Tax=Streptomyces mirabilis TaxID=68239 RepID=UPI00364D3F03